MSPSNDKIAGDAFYVYITPRADSFPWIRIWHMPHGLEGKKGAELSGLGKYWHWSLDEIAEVIGKMVVENSPILQEWKGS
jgi:hypothetical protein